MADLKEQWACFKFCFKVGENLTGTFEMLKVVFEEQTLGRK
jgi:hypothetical protein